MNFEVNRILVPLIAALVITSALLIFRGDNLTLPLYARFRNLLINILFNTNWGKGFLKDSRKKG